MAYILDGGSFFWVIDTKRLRVYPTEYRHTAEWLKDVLNGKINAIL